MHFVSLRNDNYFDFKLPGTTVTSSFTLEGDTTQFSVCKVIEKYMQ